MELYDRNDDGLLDLADMAELLNIRNNFLLTFKMEVRVIIFNRRLTTMQAGIF